MGDETWPGIGRKTTDLLELPFVFSQQPLLTVDNFIDAYKRRVTYGRRPAAWEVLATLHAAGLLVSILKDKIERADPDQLNQIPVVRVLRRAYDLAARTPRNNAAIIYQSPESEL